MCFSFAALYYGHSITITTMLGPFLWCRLYQLSSLYIKQEWLVKYENWVTFT